METVRFSLVLRQSADHVEAGGLRVHRRALGRWSPPWRSAHAYALQVRILAEIRAPVPRGDGKVNSGSCAETPIISLPRQAIGRT